MRFVDVFAGLGGFHLALHRLGHTCVFASEIDECLRALYKKNFALEAHGDIREVSLNDIPPHDILCAGFPCQPFSKAGDQQGLECPRWGGLFDNVLKILRHRTPEYLILENVPNLAWHNGGETWQKMKRRLAKAGYKVDPHRLSPHQFGIPQIRERVYIVGARSGLNGFSWPVEKGKVSTDITSALEKNPANARPLTSQVIHCLNVWQDFVAHFPKDEHLPTFPVWSMEFGATYPYETATPSAVGLRALCKHRGSHGQCLGGLAPGDRFAALPSHARSPEKQFPDWKIDFIRKNRQLYERHKSWMDRWIPKILAFPSSLQKLEWNCKDG